MKKLMIVLTASMVCAVLTGCLQSKLQSINEQERMATLALLSNDDLKNVIKALPLEDNIMHGSGARVPYPDDVKMGAIDMLYEKGEIGWLVERAVYCYSEEDTDSIIYGGRVPAKFMEKLTTPKGIDKICEMAEGARGYAYGNYAECLLRHMVTSRNQAFLQWALKNANRNAVQNVFGSKDTIAAIVDKVENYDILLQAMQNEGVSEQRKVELACGLLKKKTVRADVALKTISLFNPKDEETFPVVVIEGLAAARRIGDENLVAEIKEKAKPCIDETLAQGKEMSAKLVSIGGYFIGMEQWRADLLEQYNDDKGILWDSKRGNITKIMFNREYVCTIKGIAESNPEKWARQFLCNIGIMKDECVGKDGSDKIVATDKDSFITICIKGGEVNCVILESAAMHRKEAIRKQCEVLGDVRQFFGDTLDKPKMNGIYKLQISPFVITPAEGTLPVVKQVLKDGIVVGSKELYCGSQKFGNRIFIKTDERFATGDLLIDIDGVNQLTGLDVGVKYYKYIGTKSYETLLGCVTLHAFERFEMPKEAMED